MYEEFFNFSGQPFKLNPDPKFFFGSRSHNKAMAYLHYGLRQAEGFIVITGEIGAGKSMLISHLLDQLDRSQVVAAHLLTPNMKREDLLAHILSAYRIEPSRQSKTAEIEAFEDFLFDQLNHGRRVLLIVDEAQNLPIDTLEELRVLSNMDYDGTPLFQVFLVGQPDFKPVLAGANMEQLRQRVIASYNLEPLSADETRSYIEHRLTVVGWNGDPKFDDDVFPAIHQEADGIPRKINKLCNRILLYCTLEEIRHIDKGVVESVAADLAQEALGDVDAKTATDAAPDAQETQMPTAAVSEAGAGGDDASPLVNGASNETMRAPVENGEDASPTASREGARTSQDDELPETPLANDKDDETRTGEPVVIPFEPPRQLVSEPTENNGAANAAASEDDTPNSDHGDDASETDDALEDTAGMGEAMDTTQMEREPMTADTPEDDSSLSVLDRLRAQRARDAAAAKSKPVAVEGGPKPASMHDVADAIAAVSARGAASEKEALDDNVDDQMAQIMGAPPIQEDLKGWRLAVVNSINETRDELKRAHGNMTVVRRLLADSDKKRRERKTKVVASISRAETLLAEIRDSWR